MSLTITNNRLVQQQAIQAQTAQTQGAAATAQSSGGGNAGAAAGGTTATANPSAAMISGNAGLTSDLLSVLLQEQSNTVASGSSVATLTNLLDQQAGMQTRPVGSSAIGTTLAGILNQQDALQNGLDPSLATQSAASTGSVMSGLQDLLGQLAG